MLSLVINRIKIIIPKELPKRLGRWNIDYCNKKIDQKIDLSNEDHCGPCGQYIISKSTKTLNDKIIESVKN
jgi:hypothetical protein